MPAAIITVLAALTITVVVLLLLPFPAAALAPEEILVIANKNAFDSVKLATYYMRKRAIPEGNLLKLGVTDEEHCTREEYDKNIAAPVRKYLEGITGERKITCLLIMYGMPLRIAPPDVSAEEKKTLKTMQKQVAMLHEQLKSIDKGSEREREIKAALDTLQGRMSKLRKDDQASSLDSEIALVRSYGYPLSGRIPNPYFLGYRYKKMLSMPDEALMVCRLDGPSEKIVRRIISDSIAAETDGLRGTAYFDAKGAYRDDQSATEYAFYDRSIHRAARLMEKQHIFPVVVENTEKLFQPGDCPQAALYCGWYSLAHYVDAFTWQPGAVGYHIASSECQTLKAKESQVWCKKMLEKGVAATAGPVSEPYVDAFPVPEAFFGLLIKGENPLVECYVMTNPFLSWKMVLIGDPLYRPFKNHSLSVKEVLDN